MAQEQVLLLGGTGYVGAAFQKFLGQRGISFRNLSRQELDYTSPGRLSGFLKGSRFTFLINCAGYTGKPNVDACEQHKDETLFGNAVFPGIVHQACEEINLPWGHVSSGCIYTGKKPDGSGFTEEDLPNFCFRTNNCSFYSGTKALGEEVLSGAEQCFVWRIRIPFNNENSPRNYLSKLIKYDCLLDVENSISQLDEVVCACWECWEKKAPFGIYNTTNPGAVTTKEVVGLIQKHGICEKEYKFFDSEADFMQNAAQTPRSNCVLDSSKLERAGVCLTEVHEALEVALKNWQN